MVVNVSVIPTEFHFGIKEFNLSFPEHCVEDRTLHILHRYGDLFFHFGGVVLNIMLIHLINHHSGDSAGPYKNVFRLTCACDFIISIFSVFGQKVVIPWEGDMLFFSNSLISHRIPVIDLWTVSAITGVHLMNSIFLPTQYIYRYLCLCSTPDVRRYAMMITVAIGSSVAMIGCYVAYIGMTAPNVEYQKRAAIRLAQAGWGCYDEKEIPFMFGSDMWEIEFLIYALSVALINTCGYIVIIISEIMLVRQLNKFGAHANAATRKMQNEFKAALTALAITPLICLMVPVMYFVLGGMFSWNYPAGLSSFMTMMTSSNAVANPIVTIITVRPYRKKVKEWVNKLTRHQIFAEEGQPLSTVTKSGTFSHTNVSSVASVTQVKPVTKS